jgi:hypothetical protein
VKKDERRTKNQRQTQHAILAVNDRQSGLAALETSLANGCPGYHPARFQIGFDKPA